MKKITTMAYVAALALVSTAGLTSCKSDEPGNGNYNGETVKTEFAIKLPNQVGGSSNTGVNRMPGIAVQEDLTDIANFQGMTDIKLIPFAKLGAIEGSDARLGAVIDLTSKGDVTSEDADKPSHAKVYSDVSIPLSTASFLFYAKSARNSGNTFSDGSMVADIDKTNPSAITFDLKPICQNYQMGAGETGDKLMQYLTNVATASDGTKPWYQITAVENPAFKAMFDTLVTMHGLSSFEVERVLTDLGKSLRPLYLTSPIAHAIIDSINSDYVITTTVTSDVLTLSGDYHTFPQSLGLPVGCIDITWDGTNHKFKEGLYSNMANPRSYVYPAQLWYTVNSQIKTSNTSKQTMYDDTNDWDAILAAHTGATAVNTNTRAVAIVNPIQYAVGRLDVDVKLNAESLADNSKTYVGVATPVDCRGGFPVTAVFVGGQKQAGFDFTPKAGATLEYTIYDSMMNSTTMKAIYGAWSAMNYTMVLETTTQTDVNIAVEMVNTTGVDFYGVEGQLIPKGGRFYVVAKLAAADALETGLNKRVFIQDYITTAHLNLKSLQNAYSTIPDLRTPQLELGFSVDLEWQTGHTYNVDIN